MPIGDVRPTTLDGIKRLAAQFRKKQGIKHSAALDRAAKAAGCTNFRNAQRTLPARRVTVSNPYGLLTIYWYDKEQRPRMGRETLKVELSKPLLDICSKSEFKNVRGFGNLRMVASDHFICDTLAATQTYARERICTAERSLRFMEHTGLRPSRDHRKAYPNGLENGKLPDSDHTTDWFDPATGQFILIDEPYRNVPNEMRRAAWAAQTGWRIAKASWRGMYNPPYCDLYVATDVRSGYELDALVAKIDTMPAPTIERDWYGESIASWETFVSPMATTTQDIRRARCKGTIYPVASATSIPHSFNLGSSQRRPIGEMGIDGHTEAGRIIKAALRSGECPHGAYRRMGSLRSTLEDWMILEIAGREPEGFDVLGVYYGEAERNDRYEEIAKSSVGIIALLSDLKKRLQTAYSDCAPLRRQLHRIDMSVSLISRMKPAT